MTDYYVSPTGNDSGAGTLGDPWRTLAKVDASIQPGDTAIFRGGDYYVHENGYVDLKLTSDDPAKPITLKNYPGEEPVLHGGLTTTWTQHQSDGVTYYSAPIPAPMQTNGWWQTVIRRNGWCATPIYRTLNVTLGEGASPVIGKSSGLDLSIDGIYEALVWYTSQRNWFTRQYNTTCNSGSWFEKDAVEDVWRLRVRGVEGTPRTDGWWERAGSGDVPPEGEYTAYGTFTGTVIVSNVEAIDALPIDFLLPPSNESQGLAGYFWSDDNKLLFDLSYVDKKTWTMYWRPADTAPPIDHDNDLLISCRATIHSSGNDNIILDGLTIKHGHLGVRFNVAENWTLRNLRIISAGWHCGILVAMVKNVLVEDCLIDRGNGWLRREMGVSSGDLYWMGGHYHGSYIVGENIIQRRNVITRIIGGLGFASPNQIGNTTIDDNIVVACQRPITYFAAAGTISASIRANIAIACPTYRFAGPDIEPLRDTPITRAIHVSGYWNDAEQYGGNIIVEDNYLETTDGAANAWYLYEALRTKRHESLVIRNNVLRCRGSNAWIMQWGLDLAGTPDVVFEQTTWMPEESIGWRVWDYDKQPNGGWDTYANYNNFVTAWQAKGFGAGDTTKTSPERFNPVAFGHYMDTEPSIEAVRMYVNDYKRRVLGQRRGCLLAFVPAWRR